MACAGSSPRARGTRCGDADTCAAMRFIPAGAGNTRVFLPLPVFLQVHPRGCGEHRQASTTAEIKTGSSPRVRGTRRPRICARGRGRFIPAGAGNTAILGFFVLAALVHPRGCGEHRPFLADPMESVGSSPRVRGTLRAQKALSDTERFIPAGAGNTTTTPAKPFGADWRSWMGRPASLSHWTIYPALRSTSARRIWQPSPMLSCR